MKTRARAVLVLRCAASAKKHTAVDAIAKDLGYAWSSNLSSAVMDAVAYVCSNKPADLVSPEWWRDTLAEAAVLLDEGVV